MSLLEVLDAALGTAPPHALAGAPSLKARRIARIACGLQLGEGMVADLVLRWTETVEGKEREGVCAGEIEVWVVDDARGPRVVLTVGSVEAGPSIELDALQMIREVG